MARACRSWCLRLLSAITALRKQTQVLGWKQRRILPLSSPVVGAMSPIPGRAPCPAQPCKNMPALSCLGSRPEGKMHGPLGLLCPQSSILPDNQFFLCPKCPWQKPKLAGSISREGRNQQVITREHHSSSPKLPNLTALSVTGGPRWLSPSQRVKQRK